MLFPFVTPASNAPTWWQLYFSFALQYACLCYRKMFALEGVIKKNLLIGI